MSQSLFIKLTDYQCCRCAEQYTSERSTLDINLLKCVPGKDSNVCGMPRLVSA